MTTKILIILLGIAFITRGLYEKKTDVAGYGIMVVIIGFLYPMR